MNKRRLGLIFSNDPHTILSYGVLAGQLMHNTSMKIDWRLMSEEIQYMRPEAWNDYVRFPSGKDQIERDTQMIPRMISKYNPEFFLSIGDIQNFKMTRFYIEKTVPWIHYLPIDNNDKNTLDMNAWVIRNIDIPVAMSEFGMNFCKENGVDKVDKFIYPMVKCEASQNEKQAFEQKKPGHQAIHLGYRKVREDENEELKRILDFKKSLQMPEDAHVLLFIGRPGWRKNVQFLIGVLRKLIFERERNVVLYMHTDVKDPASTVHIGKELHAHDIPDENFRRTVILDWWKGLEQRGLNALYNIADIQISTHGGEGFGIPLAEGLACEVPFVATDCTTTPELSGKGTWSLGAKVKHIYPDRGVMRPYVDMEDFCDKVEYLLDHQETREYMGKIGRDWVNDNCSPEIITKKWMDVFDLTDVNTIEVRVDEFKNAILVDV